MSSQLYSQSQVARASQLQLASFSQLAISTQLCIIQLYLDIQSQREAIQLRAIQTQSVLARATYLANQIQLAIHICVSQLDTQIDHVSQLDLASQLQISRHSYTYMCVYQPTGTQLALYNQSYMSRANQLELSSQSQLHTQLVPIRWILLITISSYLAILLELAADLARYRYIFRQLQSHSCLELELYLAQLALASLLQISSQS